MTESWYALQTRPRHEKMVATHLRAKGIHTFLPVVSQVHRWSDRRKVIDVPLFPGYAFVCIMPTTQTYVSVLRTVGVRSFVGSRGEGLPIPDKQIEDIQKLLDQQLPCQPYPFLKVGQRIRIRSGCLDGVEGFLVAFKGTRSLVISMEPIRQSVSFCVDRCDVEVLSSPAH